MCFFTIKYGYSDILLKTLKFINSILWNVVTVCFAAIELVIVLAWLFNATVTLSKFILDVHPRSDSKELAKAQESLINAYTIFRSHPISGIQMDIFQNCSFRDTLQVSKRINPDQTNVFLILVQTVNPDR